MFSRDLRTRIGRGLLAGLIAAGFMDITEEVTYRLFRQPEVRSLDWVSVFFSGKTPDTSLQSFLSQMGHLAFGSILGGLFAALVPKAADEVPLLKGWLWASVTWMVSQGLTKVVRFPVLSDLEWGPRLKHLLLAAIYGLVLGESMRRIKNHFVWW